MNIDTGELVRLEETGRERGVVCPARAFHTGNETIENRGDHYVCSCGCLFVSDDIFHWHVLKQNAGQDLIDAVARLVKSKAAVASICRETLATLSLERNFDYTIGSEEFQEWVKIWTRQFKEAMGES